MSDDRSTIILPDNSHPGYYPAYGGGFGNGFGSFNSIADLFGLAIIASMFGWNGGNWAGGNFGGGAGAAGFLSNQLNNDSGRELIMNAVTSQGEASRTLRAEASHRGAGLPVPDPHHRADQRSVRSG